MEEAATLKTCFIAAPLGAPLDTVRASLESRGIRVLVPHDLAVGTDWAAEIKKQLAQADLVIGVVTSERDSPWVLFELGQASALGCRIVLITPPSAQPIPFALHEFLVLRVELDNKEAIDFALDQVLSAPRRSERAPAPKITTLDGLGTLTDGLLARLSNSLAAQDWRSVEEIAAEAIRSSGADVVVTSPDREIGADFAVWSDVLEPFVGNPLLVEVKGKITGGGGAGCAVNQLGSYLVASGSRWALLLYGDGPDPADPVWSSSPPNILAIPIRSLLNALRTQGFPEFVRDLRNRRVHGSAS